MAKKKKISVDLGTLIVFGVMLLSLVFAIVGICTGWTATEATNIVNGNKTLNFSTFSDWLKLNEQYVKAGESIDGFVAMAIFAIASVVFTGLTFVVAGAKRFLKKNKVINVVAFVVSVLAVVCGVVSIITTNSLCGDWSTTLIPCMAAYGAWFVAVSGMVGGLAGLYNLIKK